METSKRPWPLSTIFGIRNRIDTSPDYQRPPVWTTAQKQLLVDTILRNYDVPKLYWRRTGRKPDTYDVVDGQQRLRAIYGFFEGAFRLPKDTDPIDGHDVAGLSHEELPDDLRMRFDSYPLDVVAVEDADEDETREMFKRLQNGTTLRAQEKRNAYRGEMRSFVRSLVSHPFFASVGFKNSRYTHDLVAAQLACLQLAEEPVNVKDRDLNKMYRDHEQFDPKSSHARAVRRHLEFLAQIFPEKTPELTRFNVIALYCVVMELLSSYVQSEFAPVLRPWLFDFEKRRGAQDGLSEDEAEPEWVTYKERISHSTDAGDSIKHRTEFMLRDLLLTHPNLTLKDPERDFSHVQRLVIFRRDGQICQVKLKCHGAKVRWEGWHCDHRVPWSQGGKTSVENGQVACIACNIAKGGRRRDEDANASATAGGNRSKN